LKLNPSGVIPVIFAQAVMALPVTLVRALSGRFEFFRQFAEMLEGGALYYVLISLLIIFFSFFYTAIIFNPVELADNIRKSGGFIPGIRPGKKTAEFFDYLLTRLGVPGSLYLASLAIMPGILARVIGFPVIFSGISMLIVIGVALDTSAQMESYLIERRYEGFLATGRLRGRRGR
jgi:preprotein translocase subunit SecY